MKSLFLATAAVAAFVAAPAMAQTPPTGSIGVTWSNAEVEDFEADSYAIDGVVAGPAFGEWTVTLGAKGGWSDGNIDDKTFSGQVHLTRDFGGLRAGGFVSAGDAGPSATLWTVGGEVQKYFDKATLTGAVSYGNINEFDADIWSVGGDAGYYIMPNLRVNGSVAFSSIEAGGDSVDAYGYGVAGEYQIASTPMSVYASWDRTTVDDFDVDLDTLSIGLRFNFGGDLQQRERAGANLTRSVGGAAGIFALGL
jgi:hypothetical protein